MEVNKQLIPLTGDLGKAALRIAEKVQQFGGRALFVGGCVRDALLGMVPKDVDIEVFGIQADELDGLLKKHFKVYAVGKAFGVYKLKGVEIDVSLPRRESKIGKGHKGFKIEGDAGLSLEEAASRRDFTVNAIYWDPLTGEIIDPFDGAKDLAAKKLRHVSDKFAEDPLRVLRAMQLAARFEFKVDPETVRLCKTIEPEGLSKERIFEEWRKLFVKGKKPSIGLNFLKECGWIRYYPELKALIGCEQDPEWHPEGDVWVHTLHCLDAFAAHRIDDEWEDLVVGLGVLCHDLGKPETTFTDENGRIRAFGHESQGEGPTRNFLARMTDHKDLVESVVLLVTTHMRPAELVKANASDAAIRRLARKVGRMDRLLRVVMADMRGCPPLDHEEAIATGKAFYEERMKALEVERNAPKPYILGRHLIAMGYEPSAEFRKVLDDCFEAQLDGEYTDEAGGIEYLKQYISEKEPNLKKSN